MGFVEAIKQALSRVSFQCVSDIKEVGMATTSAIAARVGMMKEDGRISVETACKRFASANGTNHQQQQHHNPQHLEKKHIPELIKMATDEELNQGDSDSQVVWSPVHAWRALGQLKASEALEHLLGLLYQLPTAPIDMQFVFSNQCNYLIF